MTDSFKTFIGVAGTAGTAAIETATEHPATIAAAAATALFMLVSTFYKIRTGGK